MAKWDFSSWIFLEQSLSAEAKNLIHVVRTSTILLAQVSALGLGCPASIHTGLRVFLGCLFYWWAGRVSLSHRFIYFWLLLHCFQLVRSCCAPRVCYRRMIIINPSQTAQMQPAILCLLGIHLCLQTLPRCFKKSMYSSINTYFIYMFMFIFVLLSSAL